MNIALKYKKVSFLICINLCFMLQGIVCNESKAASLFPSKKRIANLLETNDIKNIIFDLDGVLLRTSKHKALKEIGIKNVLHYMFARRHKPSITRFFQAIAKIPGSGIDDVAYNNGILMPPILIDWQKGHDSNENFKKKINTYLSQSRLSPREKKVYELVTAFVFDAKRLVATRKLKKSGYSLLKTLHSTAKYRLFVLSNWDKESYQTLTEAFPEIFELMDGALFSGEVNHIKPSPIIYEKLLEKFKLNANECLFIDDEIENVKGAKMVGMQGLLATAIPALHSHLKKLKI